MLTVNAYQRLELTNSGELPLGEGSQASSSQHLSWIKKLVFPHTSHIIQYQS